MPVLGGSEYFHVPVFGVLPFFRSPVIGFPLIGECGPTVTAMAIMSRAHGGNRNVVLCADNQNVPRWSERARPHSPVARRIFRAMRLFCLHNEEDISTAYVRSDLNLFADGLTRWANREIDERASRDGMTHIDATARLWAGMSLSYNPDLYLGPPPNNFAPIGQILRFFRSCNYRVCEWRPIHFAASNVLENWGVPVFGDHLLDVGYAICWSAASPIHCGS